MIISREGQSSFVNQLEISKRGNIKTAADKTTEPKVETVLKRFQKSKDIPKEYIKKHRERLEKGHDPKKVITDFFKGLSKVKKSKTLSLKTARIFRQNGIFKLAEKNVYQDLETGDFWKISDDRGNVVRLFNEKDGVAIFDTKNKE